MSHFRLFTTHSLLVLAQGLEPIADDYERAAEMLQEIHEVLDRRPDPTATMDETFSELADTADVYADSANWPDLKAAMHRWIEAMEDAQRTIEAEQREDDQEAGTE